MDYWKFAGFQLIIAEFTEGFAKSTIFIVMQINMLVATQMRGLY